MLKEDCQKQSSFLSADFVEMLAECFYAFLGKYVLDSAGVLGCKSGRNTDTDKEIRKHSVALIKLVCNFKSRREKHDIAVAHNIDKAVFT